MSNVRRSLMYVFKSAATAALGIAALAASGAARAGCEAEIQQFCVVWERNHMNFSIPECTRLFNSEFAKGRTAAQTQAREWLRGRSSEGDFQNYMSGKGGPVSDMVGCAATLKDNQSANLDEGRRARAEQGAAEEERSRQAYDNLPKGRMASVEKLERKRREEVSTTPSRQPAPCDGCGVR